MWLRLRSELFTGLSGLVKGIQKCAIQLYIPCGNIACEDLVNNHYVTGVFVD